MWVIHDILMKWALCLIRRGCGRTFSVPEVVVSFQVASALLAFVTFPSKLAHRSYHNKIPELGVLGKNTVFSMNRPLGVTLHSAQSLFCCLCASCPAYWMLDFVAWKAFPVYSPVIPSLLWTRWCRAALSLRERAIRFHVAIYCTEFFKKVREMEGICVGCMSRVGLNRPLVAATLSFLPGSGHSSSIPYPMSLCCWDKVLFVCPWLLARAHRALKLCLNDGIFISIPLFRARSHPSLLSLCTEPHP